jgi:hypothetical protein
MDLVFNVVEQWGIYLIAGTIAIYFGWNLLAFIRDQPVAFKHDPILSTTTLGWGAIWVVGNGVGNMLFLFGVASMIREIVVHHTGEFDLPALPGVETLVFLMGLMPSLYQFRYQADPDYIATLTLARRGVAIGMTVADGFCCALGWYWWLLPPTFASGGFDFIYDRTLLGAVLLWSIFSSYIAQYMAHMQAFDLLGLPSPSLPNPLSGLREAFAAYFPWADHPASDAEDTHQPSVRALHPKRSVRSEASRSDTAAHRSHRTHTPSEYGDDSLNPLQFEEMEPQL